MNIEKYIEYIKEKHGNQKRKQGTPYYLHPVAVCRILYNKGIKDGNVLTAALFHDLIEDTTVTYDEIKEISNEKVAKIVKLLSKEKGYKMTEYIKGIREDKSAKLVKLADRLHNLSEATSGTEEFQKKYIKETEDWYVDLAKGTIFEEDINHELQKLKEYQVEYER